jgi:hypothetical protein
MRTSQCFIFHPKNETHINKFVTTFYLYIKWFFRSPPLSMHRFRIGRLSSNRGGPLRVSSSHGPLEWMMNHGIMHKKCG